MRRPDPLSGQRRRFAAALALTALLVHPAQARDRKAPAPKDDFAIPDAIDSRLDVSTDSLFGFTDGTDTNSEGEREVSLDAIARFDKRAVTLDDGTPGGKGRFTVLGVQGSLQYGVTDAFNVEVGVFGDLRRVKNVPNFENKSAANFDGASAQFKYRLIERTPENPVGLALSIEPRWARIADQEGVRQDSFSLESKLMLDARLVPGLLWYGVNIGFEPQAGKFHRGGGERQSAFSVSNALSMRVAGASPFGVGTYLGVEASYQRAYAGLFAQTLMGEAAFVGPTLYHQFSKSAYVSAALSAQVWGRQHDPAPLVSHKLDLWNFERYVARVKVGFNF